MTIIASNTLRSSTQLQILPNRRAFVWQNTVHLQSSHLFFFFKKHRLSRDASKTNWIKNVLLEKSFPEKVLLKKADAYMYSYWKGTSIRKCVLELLSFLKTLFIMNTHDYSLFKFVNIVKQMLRRTTFSGVIALKCNKSVT